MPFKVVEVKKLGSRDWNLTLEKDGDFEFEFTTVQFVWINTNGKTFDHNEHPFSIASSPSSLPRMSFIICVLRDFTSRLDQLKPGKRVHVDGRQGVFTLKGKNAAGIGLIAGGAGFGAIFALLRQIRDTSRPRPVNLMAERADRTDDLRLVSLSTRRHLPCS
jgi:predicted ferric reductase